MNAPLSKTIKAIENEIENSKGYRKEEILKLQVKLSLAKEISKKLQDVIDLKLKGLRYCCEDEIAVRVKELKKQLEKI